MTWLLRQPPGPPGETFEAVTFVEGLRNPWSMAFLPNGDMLVTERGGQLRIVRDGRLLDGGANDVPTIALVRAIAVQVQRYARHRDKRL